MKNNSEEIIKLFIWNNQSFGDALTMIPVIEYIKEKYPNVKFKIGCYKKQAYIYEHLTNDIETINQNYEFCSYRKYFWSHIREKCPDDYIPIHPWLGNYNFTVHSLENQIKSFNYQFEEKKVPLKIDFNIPPYINLPFRDIKVRPNAIYIENGPTISGHGQFFHDIEKYALFFPKLNFYTTYDSKCKLKNVVNCFNCDLIDLQNISNKCKLFIGKGSGPFITTFTRENESKLKILSDNRPFWDLDKPNTIELNDEKLIIEQIRIINKEIS